MVGGSMELDTLADSEIHLESRKTEESITKNTEINTKNVNVIQNTNTDKLPQVLATIAANMMVFAVGTLLTWTSPAIPMLQIEDGPFQITDYEASWVGSLLALGSVFGGPPFGWLVNHVGRKLTILALAVPITIAWILIIATNSVVWLCVARFVSGLSLGGVSFVIPIYVAEVVEPSVRGPLSSVTQVGFNVGILYSYGVGAMGKYMLLNLSCIIIPIVFVLLFVWMPEAPQYLLSKGDNAGAAKSLQWLRGKESNVEQELQKLKDAAEENAKNEGSFKDMIKNPVAVRALVISMGLVAAQQLGGICVVLFYTQTIFQAAGSAMSATVSSVLVGVVMLIASFITMPIVDRLGRRILLMASSLLELLSLAALGLYFLLKEKLEVDVSALSWLPLACLIVYISAYCLGLGPLPWVVMSEVLPPNVKGIAGAIVSSFCWIASFILTNTFQSFVDLLGRHYAFWFFSLMCALSTVFVYTQVPETKGISLQEIQQRLAKGRKEVANGVI